MQYFLVQTAQVELRLAPYDFFTIWTRKGRIRVEKITISAWHISLHGRKVNLMGKTTDRRISVGPVEGYLDRLPTGVQSHVKRQMIWLVRPANGYSATPHGLTKTVEIGTEDWMSLLDAPAGSQDDGKVRQIKGGSAAS